MDRDKDAKLTYDEFVEGSKQDPTIVQVRTAIRAVIAPINRPRRRHYPCMTVSYEASLFLLPDGRAALTYPYTRLIYYNTVLVPSLLALPVHCSGPRLT